MGTATPAWSLEYGIYGLWAMDYGLWSMRSGICWGRSVHSTIWGLFVWFTVFNYELVFIEIDGIYTYLKMY